MIMLNSFSIRSPLVFVTKNIYTLSNGSGVLKSRTDSQLIIKTALNIRAVPEMSVRRGK
jgi:hypothetical protein